MKDRTILADAIHYMNLVDEIEDKVEEDIVIAKTGNFFNADVAELQEKAKLYNTHTKKMSYLISKYTANPNDSTQELLEVAIEEAKRLLKKKS